MKWTGLNELRSKFLAFFESKGHTILPSAPLVPRDDNSLLLINSGMAPLKKYFMGLETIPNNRAASCQKCIRTPDIERVGKTARHGTYFEMLGNFSFGDYFKREATAWAWEFITKELEIPVDRLWVSVYLDDDEAWDIWVNEVGVSPDRMVRLGREDNFWEIGSGPCGPCSEIYYDRGPEYSCGSPTCAVGCDCDRYVEFWNLVFTQFNSDGKGNYTPLEHPNIDTGMGLERIACIMQGVENLFEVDTVAKIMGRICEIAGVQYKENEKKDVSLRVITDHIRSTVMLVGDGVLPSNEGRGYVLRRLLRRAARHGRLLGVDGPFLYKAAETVIDENKTAYPQLEENRDYIVKVIRMEEERFEKTIGQGMELLNSIVDRIEHEMSARKEMPGDLAFKLYDTFGFPIDLTREILGEHQITLNEEEFYQLMKEQRERARAARAKLGDVSWEADLLSALEGPTGFVGYQKLDCKAVIRAIVADGKLADAVSAGQKAAIVLDKTPFYAESGGQAGDMGMISDGKSIFEVYDCKKSPTGQILHIGEMKAGGFVSGDAVTAAFARPRRSAVARNHTAAHLMQAALRSVLGDHVHQAGQLVDDECCRFDFTHFQAMTPEEIERVENIVNEMIFDALPVVVQEMPIEEAKKIGAMALFSEKYGDTVRVVNAGGRSIELCGGTHVPNTAQIGVFKIVRESSVAAGVRRIEAVTGTGVLKYLKDVEGQLSAVADNLKAGPGADLAAKAASLSQQLRDNEREIEQLSSQLAASRLDGLFENAAEVDGVRVITAAFNGSKPDALRLLGDRIKERAEPIVAVLTSINDQKASILAVAGKEAVSRGVHAGKLIKELTAQIGGSGGGRPDSAMGGTSEIFKVDEAVAKAGEMVSNMIARAKDAAKDHAEKSGKKGREKE